MRLDIIVMFKRVVNHHIKRRNTLLQRFFVSVLKYTSTFDAINYNTCNHINHVEIFRFRQKIGIDKG